MSLKVHLVIIDPQNDFCDILSTNGSPVGTTLPDGTQFRSTLPVPGAVDDMKRLAAMIDRVGHKLEDIHVTLDSHQIIDVAHPGMWRNSTGDQPAPFTIITADDIENDIWFPRDVVLKSRMLKYARALESAGNYPLMVWPVHCHIGSWGHNIQEDLFGALSRWEDKEFANIDFVTKGTNAFTEHYGALMAEVPDPEDPSTQLNTDFLEILSRSDIVVVAGEALSHCVKTTVDQIADNIGDEHIKKFHILTDCSSPVPKVGDGPDFPAIGEAWLKEMEARGMTLTTSVEFLA